jgi:hypothetical protein
MSSLTDQLKNALDIIGGSEEAGAERMAVSAESAAGRLLEYKQRTKRNLDDFIPLVSTKGKEINPLVSQIGASTVDKPKYWSSAGGNSTGSIGKKIGAKKIKNSNVVMKPGASKRNKKKQVAVEYNDRRAAKVSKKLNKKNLRKG